MGELYNRKYSADFPYETRRLYSCAKAQAKYYKQEWAFTLETWWQFWDESGLWEHRGNRGHQYTMVRLDTIEAWSPKNCIIVPRRTMLRKNGYEVKGNLTKTDWQPRHDVRNKK